MNETSWVELGLSLVSGIFTILLVVLWWFVRQRDEERKDQDRRLTDEVVRLERYLNDLKLTLASDYYAKEEMDKRFDKLEDTIREMWRELGGKMDALKSK